MHEVWVFTQKNRPFDDIDSFSEELKRKTQQAKAFFDDEKVASLFAFVRDKFGFHYEYQNNIDSKVDDAFNGFFDVVNWLSPEDSGNEIFATSNLVALKIIVGVMKGSGFDGKDEELIKKLIDLALEVSSLLQALVRLYMVETTPVMWREIENVELEAPYASSIRFPAIIAKNHSPKT